LESVKVIFSVFIVTIEEDILNLFTQCLFEPDFFVKKNQNLHFHKICVKILKMKRTKLKVKKMSYFNTMTDFPATATTTTSETATTTQRSHKV